MEHFENYKLTRGLCFNLKARHENSYVMGIFLSPESSMPSNFDQVLRTFSDP